MDGNGQIISLQTAIVTIGLLIFGFLYNWLVVQIQKKTAQYTAEMVVGGVVITVVASGFVIGWGNSFILLVFFTASGLPMLIGSWIRIAHDQEEARKEFKRIFPPTEQTKESK